MAGVLAVAAAAVLAGHRSVAAIAAWAADAPPRVLAALGARGDPLSRAWQAPSAATIRRVLARIDAELLDHTLGAWLVSTPTVDRYLAGRVRPGPGSRRGRPPLMIRSCEDNRRADGGRRPQRKGRSCPMAGRAGEVAGPGRGPLRPGGATPSAVWDHDGVRDDVRGYLVEHLGEAGAVLAVDETGDLKKGTRRSAWQRQYTATAGRIDNAQVAVYLVDATDAGHAIVDRELYVPRGWIDDPDRCRAAGIPEQVGVATKPALATRMLTRALDACVPAAWSSATRPTAPTWGCGPSWRPAGSGTCWRWPATTAWSPTGPPTAPTRCSGVFRRGPGSACRPEGHRRPQLLRLGVCPPRPLRPRSSWPGRAALAAAPPQPHDRRTGLLPLLDATPGAAGHPG